MDLGCTWWTYDFGCLGSIDLQRLKGRQDDGWKLFVLESAPCNCSSNVPLSAIKFWKITKLTYHDHRSIIGIYCKTLNTTFAEIIGNNLQFPSQMLNTKKRGRQEQIFSWYVLATPCTRNDSYPLHCMERITARKPIPILLVKEHWWLNALSDKDVQWTWIFVDFFLPDCMICQEWS